MCIRDSILTVVPLAAIIFAAWYMERHLTDHWSLPLSLCLIIGGGIGNLIDRIFLGFVTEMCIRDRNWPESKRP